MCSSTQKVPVGTFWDKEISENVRRAEFFVPLVSSSYLFSPYIVEKELKEAARLLREKKLERILQVNLAYDGDPPDAVREVVSQIQSFRWRSPDDTPRLCREIANGLPASEVLVKGMRSFSTADERLFSQLGREEEIAAFLALLADSRLPFVLIHGVSGAGKTSFLKAGVTPRLGDRRWAIAELTANINAGFGALAADDSTLVFLDQFEQSLIRFATDEDERRSLEESVMGWVSQRPGRKVIFCLRDEYRTAFDTMLPKLSSSCAHFALLPLRPVVAARVLGLLLENVGVKYEQSFLPQLCAEYLAEGVPKTVLPALLQMVAQYCRNRGIKLDKTSWDRLISSDSSLFEDHIRESVLERIPGKLSLVEATQSLAALAEGDIKSRRKSAAEIADDYKLKPETVSRTLEMASMPHARVVMVEPDAETNRPMYRLVHDLFAPDVRALHRDAKLRGDFRRRVVFITSLTVLLAGLLSAGILAFWQWKVAAQQRNEAIVRQLTAESTVLRTGPARFRMQSVLLAAEAHRRKPTWESDAALRAALERLPDPVVQIPHGAKVTAAQLSSDGKKLVTGSLVVDGAQVRVWNIETGGDPEALALGREVYDVAFSADGNLVAIGAGKRFGDSVPEGKAVVWDVRQKKQYETAFQSPVTRVAFIPGTTRVVAVASEAAKVVGVDDGAKEVTINFGTVNAVAGLNTNVTRLAIGDGLNVKVYELPEGKMVFEKKANADDDDEVPRMQTLTFNADGTVLAGVVSSGDMFVWNIASNQVLSEFTHIKMKGSSGFAVSDDGKLIAYADYEGFIYVSDVSVRRNVAGVNPDVRVSRFDGIKMRLAFLPETYNLMAVTDGTTVRYLRLDYRSSQAGPVEIKELLNAVPEAGISSLSLSPTGQVVVGDELGRATVWGWTSTRSVVEGGLMAFSPSGRFMISGGGGLFDMVELKQVADLPVRGRKNGFVFSKDGRLLAVRSKEEELIDVYDLNSRVRVHQLNCGERVREFAFSSDGQRLICSFYGSSLTQTEVKSGNMTVLADSHDEITKHLSPRATYFVTTVKLPDSGEKKWLLRVFEVQGLRKTLEVEFKESRTYPEFTFSPDDRYVSVVVDARTVAAWETSSGRELMRFAVDADVREMAFGGDGMLAVASGSEAIVLNLKTQELVTRLRPEAGVVLSVGFSPDARHLIAGSSDNKTRVWSIGQGQLVVIIEGMEVDPHGTNFTPDGKYIVIEGFDWLSRGGQLTRVLLWRPQDLLDEACKRITHNLTEKDWRQYFGSQTYEQAPCGNMPSRLTHH